MTFWWISKLALPWRRKSSPMIKTPSFSLDLWMICRRQAQTDSIIHALRRIQVWTEFSQICQSLCSTAFVLPRDDTGMRKNNLALHVAEGESRNVQKYFFSESKGQTHCFPSLWMTKLEWKQMWCLLQYLDSHLLMFLKVSQQLVHLSLSFNKSVAYLHVSPPFFFCQFLLLSPLKVGKKIP